MLESLAGLQVKQSMFKTAQLKVKDAVGSLMEVFQNEDTRIKKQDERLKPWLVYFQVSVD